MNGIATRPKIGYMVDGEFKVLLNEINTITELGDKVETGIKAKKWRATRFAADDSLDIKMTGEVLEEIKVAGMPTGDAAEMEVVYKKKYIPVRRHKKKRIAKKWRKYGYIERTFFIRGRHCAVVVNREEESWPKTLFGNEMRMIAPRNMYNVEIDMKDVESRTEDRRITWKEYEEIRRSASNGSLYSRNGNAGTLR